MPVSFHEGIDKQGVILYIAFEILANFLIQSNYFNSRGKYYLLTKIVVVMKKFALMPLVLLFVISINAQENFSLPELNDNQIQWRLVSQWNAMVLNQINYAKSIGQSVEDIAQFTGNQFKLSWNKESGWKGLVNGTLNNWTIMIPDNKLEILEQSDNMIRFKSKTPYEWLKNNGPRYNVSYDEYMTFLKITHKIIGEHLGANIFFEDVEDGINVTIKKI